MSNRGEGVGHILLSGTDDAGGAGAGGGGLGDILPE